MWSIGVWTPVDWSSWLYDGQVWFFVLQFNFFFYSFGWQLWYYFIKVTILIFHSPIGCSNNFNHATKGIQSKRCFMAEIPVDWCVQHPFSRLERLILGRVSLKTRFQWYYYWMGSSLSKSAKDITREPRMDIMVGQEGSVMVSNMRKMKWKKKLRFWNHGVESESVFLPNDMIPFFEYVILNKNVSI